MAGFWRRGGGDDGDNSRGELRLGEGRKTRSVGMCMSGELEMKGPPESELESTLGQESIA